MGCVFWQWCVEFFIKLVWAVNPPTVTPQIDITTFNRFWIEDKAIFIFPTVGDMQKNAIQGIIKQLSTAPATTTTGRLRLEIWSRKTNDSADQLRAVVAEYDPSQVVMIGQDFRGPTIRIVPPQAPGREMFIELSDKTDPAINGKNVEGHYSTYLWAILILAIIAILIVIAIAIKK